MKGFLNAICLVSWLLVRIMLWLCKTVYVCVSVAPGHTGLSRVWKDLQGLRKRALHKFILQGSCLNFFRDFGCLTVRFCWGDPSWTTVFFGPHRSKYKGSYMPEEW